MRSITSFWCRDASLVYCFIIYITNIGTLLHCQHVIDMVVDADNCTVEGLYK